MGRDKASLPVGDEAMLARTMRLVAEVVPREQVVLVAAAEQRLPSLPFEAAVVRDRAPDQGPLPAIVDGLAALPTQVTAAFVTACDSPLLEPALAERLFQLLSSDDDVVVPTDGEQLHLLLAVYRPRVADALRRQLAERISSLHGALGGSSLRVCRVPVEELRDVDAELRSFLNCNAWDDYEAALNLVIRPNGPRCESPGRSPGEGEASPPSPEGAR
jgi:molybdopterin-guanine dinucleotide biosynthesis protein A